MAWTETLSAVGQSGSLLAPLFEEGVDVSSEFLLTPEQQASMSDLLNFARTGQLAGLDSKALYDLTKTELTGQGVLDNLLAKNPDLYDMAQQYYSDVLNDMYDPYNEKGAFAAYKTNALAELAKATDDMNAAMGASGNFFSTNRNRALSDLQSNTQNNLLMQMAQMYENNAAQKNNAANALTNLQGQKQAYDLGNIGAAYQYGGRARDLKQQDLNNRLNAYSTVLGKNVDTYSPDVSTGGGLFSGSNGGLFGGVGDLLGFGSKGGNWGNF